ASSLLLPLRRTNSRHLIERSAPARQIDRVCALGKAERLLHRLLEILLYAFARDFAAQEIRPQEFAERGDVLCKAADAAQFPGEAAERIVLEAGNRFRQVLEPPAFALGVVGIGPSLVIHHGPERLALDHGEIADDRDQDML